METNAIDPWTNKGFTKHRSNQIFSCKENQVRYNNEKARRKRMAMATINKTLDKNRNVLKSILGEEEGVKRSRDFLLGAGYHFGVFTHTIQRDQVLWKCVYEYGITQLEDQNFIIRKTS